MQLLTDRQRKVLETIKEYITKTGRSPTIPELCKKLKIKWTQGVAKHLQALDKKGYIKKNHRARGIQITDFQEIRPVPVIGEITASKPILAEENIQGTIAMDEKIIPCKNTFFLKVKGKSMKKAGINNGDYVLIRQYIEVKEKDIVAVLIGEEATIKYFYPKENEITLKPANPRFKPIIFKNGQENEKEFKILGKVIAVLRLM